MGTTAGRPCPVRRSVVLAAAVLAVVLAAALPDDASAQARDPDKSFAVAANGPYSYGIWSDGSTMWVADDGAKKIFAYNMVTKMHDTSKDFDTLRDAFNVNIWGITSDGSTMWVVDYTDDKIYGYKMSDKTHDSAKDFGTLSAALNNDPAGITTDGSTMWVADDGDDKIYAYNAGTMNRDSSKDFNTLIAADNTDIRGIWTDGDTMWVADDGDDKIYAYNVATKMRDSSKDFGALRAAGNHNPTGIWANGETMYVMDSSDRKIYAYHFDVRELPDGTLDVATMVIDPEGSQYEELPFRTDSTGGWHFVNMRPSGKSVDITLHLPIGVTGAFQGQSGASPLSARVWATPGCNQYDLVLSNGQQSKTLPILLNGVYLTVHDCWAKTDDASDTTQTTTQTTTTPPSRPSGTDTPIFGPASIPFPSQPRDQTPPAIISIDILGDNVTSSRLLVWNVTFSEPVTWAPDTHLDDLAGHNATRLTIPDMNATSSSIRINGTGQVTGGHVSVSMEGGIESQMAIDLVAPDCRRIHIHNQTTIFWYTLRQPQDISGLAGSPANGTWTLEIVDTQKYFEATLDSWNLTIQRGSAVSGSGASYVVSEWVSGEGEHLPVLPHLHTVRDLAGNPLADTEPQDAPARPVTVVDSGLPGC